MLKIIRFTVLYALAACLAISCNTDGSSGNEGFLQLSITDSPTDASNVKSVWITITEIEYMYENQWLSTGLLTEPETIDLLTLSHGRTADFPSIPLPAGSYGNFRFILDIPGEDSGLNTSGCYIEFTDGSTAPLFVPSGEQSGYKAIGSFEIEKDQVTGITVDFNLRKMVVKKGNGNYLLKPVLRMIKNKEAGTITVPIDDNLSYNNIIVYAYNDDQYNPNEAANPTEGEVRFPGAVTSVNADANGDYVLPFLPPGIYDLVITGYTDETFVEVIRIIDNIAVTEGTGSETTPFATFLQFHLSSNNASLDFNGEPNVIQISDGSFIIAVNVSSGSINGENISGSTDIALIKISETGNLEWEKRYGGNGADIVNSLIESHDNGYIIAGASNSSDLAGVNKTQDLKDYYIIKTDSSGNLLWQDIYNIDTTNYNDDEPFTIIASTSGGYIAAGQSISTTTDKDVSVFRLNEEGDETWKYNYGGSGHDIMTRIHETSSGNIILTGTSESTNTSASNPGVFSIYSIELNSLGTLQNEYIYGGSGQDQCYSSVYDSGEIIYSGYTASLKAPEYSYHDTTYVVKTNESGTIIWEYIYGGDGQNWGFSIDSTSDNGFIIVGSSYSTDIDNYPNEGSSDVYLLKIDSSGTKEWERLYGGAGNERAISVIETRDGGFFIIGTTNSGTFMGQATNGAGMFFLKLNSLGNL